MHLLLGTERVFEKIMCTTCVLNLGPSAPVVSAPTTQPQHLPIESGLIFNFGDPQARQKLWLMEHASGFGPADWGSIPSLHVITLRFLPHQTRNRTPNKRLALIHKVYHDANRGPFMTQAIGLPIPFTHGNQDLILSRH